MVGMEFHYYCIYIYIVLMWGFFLEGGGHVK